MKSKLLPRVWVKTMSVLCGFILPCFLCSSVQANGTKPSIKHSVNTHVLSAHKAYNFQDTVVTGKITSDNGIGLTGASVREKGTGNGTVSDRNGNFTLKVKNRNSILVISFVGYTDKEIRAGDPSNNNITLESISKKLDDVVVVGYGTKKKSELTNAVVQTTGKEIAKATNISLSNSLAGRLPGLFVQQTSSVPGFDDAQILVRGAKTYRNSSALIVIDGVANADPDGLNRLDPNDIESISVLKDASAAIYGAQSAGGVVLVTTKRGKSGKPVFDITNTNSYLSPTAKTKSANAFEYMNVLNDRRALEGTPPDFPDALIEEFKTGKRRPENWYNALVAGPAKQSRQSLDMRGGSEKVKYFISLGSASQGGILRGDDKTKLKQYNVRSNVDVTVTKDLEVGIDLSGREKYTQTPQGGAGGEIGYFASTSPLQEAYIGGDYRYPGQGWSQLNPAARILSPGYRKYTSDVASGTLKFKYTMPFIKGLALDGFASTIKTTNYNKSFNWTWFYFEKDAAGNIVKRPSRSVEDIGLKEEYYQSKRITENLKLSYNTIINHDHKISAFVSYEQMTYDDNDFWAQRLGFDSPLIDQLFAGSPNPANGSNSGTASVSARQNYFGRASYEYKGKYLLGASARYDGSPIFPKDTRFGFFPQASAAWVVSKESFMPKDLFSNFKIRASWGRLGNDRVDPFQYIGAYGYSAGWVVNGTDVSGIAPTSTPNPKITWEVTETSDLGLELGFLNNMLTFEVDVYKNNTSHILGKRQASIPGYTGLVLPDENIGKMNNHGIEFQAGYQKNFGDLNLRINGNVAYTANKIVFFDETPQSEPYQKLEGQPLGSQLVYKAIGIYRTQADLDQHVNYPGASLGGLIFADLNHDGKIDVNDQYMFNVSPFPTLQFGLNIGMDYKGFDLAMLFQGQSGAKWRLNNGFNSGAGGNGLAYVANNSYSLKNPNSALPMIEPNGTASSNSDFYYHNAVWGRLKSLQLGYNLPVSLLSKIKVSALRVYVSGDNLPMLFNNLKKYGAGDPEFLSSNGGAYPNMRSLSFGLNVTL